MPHRNLSTRLAIAAACCAGIFVAPAFADDATRLVEDPIGVKNAPWLLASPDFKGGGGAGDGGTAGAGCPQVISTYTNAAFDGGQYIVQAGLAEGEIAACSYTVSPGDFPLRIDLIEMIFATSNAAVSTTTKWTVMVWKGTPAARQTAAISCTGCTVPISLFTNATLTIKTSFASMS